MKLRSLSVLALVGVVGLSACGDDSTHNSADMDESDASTMAPSDAAFNDADVAFAQGMIPHHEQAIEMSDMALDPTVGAGAQVRDLATSIKAAQDPEVGMMTSWLTEWGQSMEMDMNGGEMAAMDGMMTTAEMDTLSGLTGDAFDTLWLDMMIRHHEGAIVMAQTVTASGKNPAVLELAGQVVTAQQAEIQQMQALLAG
ncbi:MAG: DUF305 domain-containing protein [Actinomycetota bacterium]|nr:DUF305 domain-containing protein [Actinomycetota bacterium]